MANPSNSTASPDPRNPEQTSNSVRPEPVEGPDGRPGFDKLSPNGILDRRTLLTGAAACVVAGPPIAAAGAMLPDGADPAVLAYARVLEADEATWAVEANEDDPVYRGLCDAYDRAEAAFAATRATSPDGVRAKLDRIAYRCQWEPERAFHDCPLVPSIVADFARILTRRAL